MSLYLAGKKLVLQVLCVFQVHFFSDMHLNAHQQRSLKRKRLKSLGESQQIMLSNTT